MGRKIAIVSGKGGVGKSTIACGISLALAKNGHSVCLIDLDIGLNNIDVMLNVQSDVVYDLCDLLNGKCRIKQALVSVKETSNLFVLPSTRFDDGSVVSLNSIQTLVDKLANVFDYVIIDSPAGVGKMFEIAVKSSNEAIVVVSPSVSSLRDAEHTISFIKGANIDNVSIIVNRIRGDLVARKEMLSHQHIEMLLRTKLLGVVPENEQLSFIARKNEDFLQGKSLVIFSILVHNLKSDKIVIFDYLSKYKGLSGLIRRKIIKEATK